MQPSFVPGSRDSEQFDLFLKPIVEDLDRMGNSIIVHCADGVVSRLHTQLLFTTADWPAASKVLGINKHNVETACPRCLKKGLKVGLAGNRRWMILSYERKYTKTFLRSDGAAGRSEILSIECPGHRIHNGTVCVWKRLKKERQENHRASLADIIKSTVVKRKPYILKLSKVPVRYNASVAIAMGKTSGLFLP
eukprot:gb/GEZJ01004045.1/.p1 GENE.gb/GEZJ01004045.1/~~gb/GEZJ01004045.1/.p1  ORF type:complete len:193 (-),score=15.80 gb/GEZJ01004045.1/:284-862(-)